LPNDIEANVEMPAPEDGKSSNGDGTDAEAGEVVDSDDDKEPRSISIWKSMKESFLVRLFVHAFCPLNGLGEGGISSKGCL
jgi:hypothetical protein